MKYCCKGDILLSFFFFFPRANLKDQMKCSYSIFVHKLEMNWKSTFKTKSWSLIFPPQQSRGFLSPHVILHQLTLHPDLLLNIPNLWVVFYGWHYEFPFQRTCLGLYTVSTALKLGLLDYQCAFLDFFFLM